MAKVIDSKIPAGPVPEKWKEYKAHQRLVNPKNKLKWYQRRQVLSERW